MPDIYFDFGNSDVKYYDGMTSYGFYRHAIVQLSASDWTRAVGRAKQPPPGYAEIEGRFYAFGDQARRYILKEQPRGASRYTTEYYGAALMYAISELYEPGTRKIHAYASHAPRDIDYADDIRRASLGQWTFTTHKGTYKIHLASVETFDEPLGGFNHYILTKDGKVSKRNPLRDATTLVLDIGGYTCDIVAIDPGGAIDVSSLRSSVTGMLNVFENFEKELRSMYRDDFRHTNNIDKLMLERALQYGVYQYGKVELPCADIAQASVNMLTNDIQQVIQSEIANYNYVLLTGGGSVVMLPYLSQAMPKAQFITADDDQDMMRFANVFGGQKLFALLKNLGVI